MRECVGEREKERTCVCESDSVSETEREKERNEHRDTVRETKTLSQQINILFFYL